VSKNYLKSSIFAFFFSLLSFLVLIAIYINFKHAIDTGISDLLNVKNINYPLLFYFLFLFTTLVSFLSGSFNLASYFTEKKKINNNILKNVFLNFVFIILPFYIFFNWYFTFIKLLIFKRLFVDATFKKIFGKAFFFLFVVFILTPFWIYGYLAIKDITTKFILRELGYSPYTELIAGTGSMYPTFPKGDKITPIAQFNQIVAKPTFISYPSGIVLFGKRYFGRNLERGDIVSFENQKTYEITQKQYGAKAGFIKRIIGLPEDTIQLRAGIVYLNGKPLKEPYTAKPQSTFGEDFLSECKVVTVPKGNVFVMGDNRKGSGDSREIGFINLKDIDHVLPIENQSGVWDKHFRNTSKDFDETSKITLNINDYLRLLNEKRAKANAKPLSYEPKLEESSRLRGEAIIKFDDFSFNATRSGLTMQNALSQVGYSNIMYGETPTQGYFEASELIENQFLFPKTKDFLLDKDYEDFGISSVEGEINNCPTQVIVAHFAGYIPPNYSGELIKSWEEALTSLNNVSKGWKDLRDSQAYNKDKTDIDRIIQIINERQTMISGILDKMHNNLWLTNEQNNYAKTIDKDLGEEEISLAKKINDLLK